MDNTAPDQIQQAQKVLSSFLGHDVISKGEAYRVLRAVEVSSTKDLMGRRTKITSEDAIFYRTAIQNKRDAYELDLRAFIKESLDEITSADNKKNAEFNWRMFQGMVLDTIDTHMELQFGDLWSKQTYAFRSGLSNEVAILVLSIIRKNKNAIRQMTSNIPKSAQELVSELLLINFSDKGYECNDLSVSIPILAELIFKNKFSGKK